jgi:transcriptional regulator with XRE-family HTH domain
LYDDKKFTLNIWAARVNKRIPRKEAAEKLGVSVPTISNWENGRTMPDAKHVMMMAELYGLPASMLRFDD